MVDVIRIPKDRKPEWEKIKEILRNNILFISSEKDFESRSNSEVLKVLIDTFFNKNYYNIERKVEENIEKLKEMKNEIKELKTILLLILTNLSQLKEKSK